MNSLFALVLAFAALAFAQSDSTSSTSQSTTTVKKTRTSTLTATSTKTRTPVTPTTTVILGDTTIPGPAQTTLSLFSPCRSNSTACSRIENTTFYGAVLTANASATIVEIDCSARAGTVDCRGGPVTVTQAPSLYAFRRNNATADSVSCSISGVSSGAVCVEAVRETFFPATTTGTGSTFAPASRTTLTRTVTLTYSSADIHYYPQLVITSGAERLATVRSSASASTTASSATGSASSTGAPSGASSLSTIGVGAIFGVMALASAFLTM